MVHIACEVKNFEPEKFMDGKEARRRDRFEQFASVAADQAIADAGLTVTEFERAAYWDRCIVRNRWTEIHRGCGADQ